MAHDQRLFNIISPGRSRFKRLFNYYYYYYPIIFIFSFDNGGCIRENLYVYMYVLYICTSSRIKPQSQSREQHSQLHNPGIWMDGGSCSCSPAAAAWGYFIFLTIPMPFARQNHKRISNCQGQAGGTMPFRDNFIDRWAAPVS